MGSGNEGDQNTEKPKIAKFATVWPRASHPSHVEPRPFTSVAQAQLQGFMY